jgi:hypothetical protein
MAASPLPSTQRFTTRITPPRYPREAWSVSARTAKV